MTVLVLRMTRMIILVLRMSILVFANIIFLKISPYTFEYCLKYFVIINAINTGSTGPELAINRVNI